MKRIIIVGLVVALAGCATVQTESEGTKLTREQVKRIEPGVTSRQAAVELFGEPDETFSEDGGERLVYTFREEKTRAYLGGLIEDRTRASEASTTLEVVIRDGVVHSYNFSSVGE